jgi:hypothetical protein
MSDLKNISKSNIFCSGRCRETHGKKHSTATFTNERDNKVRAKNSFSFENDR